MKRFSLILLALLFVVCGKAFGDDELPSAAPTMTIVKGDSISETTLYEGSAPVTGQFAANVANLGSYTPYYEWRFYENGVVVAQDGKEARRCYETGEKLGSVKCKMRLARCKLLGIGGRREKKAGLDLCRQALELAKESSEKEDYGYEAEMNLLRRTIAENES